MFECMYRVEIACEDTSYECADQVWIWLGYVDFDKVIPLKNMKISVSIL
jgi:hypothetical protein